jgi:hypothetical protein
MTRPISAPFGCLLAALVTVAACATAAGAENWPNRAVHFIIPFPAGGASDGMGRVLARLSLLGEGIVDFFVRRTRERESIQALRGSKRL